MTTTIVREVAHTGTADDAPGRFGPFGGRYVPETLTPALDELARAFERLRADAGFAQRLDALLADYVGRPTPLLRARRLEQAVGRRSPRIWLKREDLCHTGSHKLNNALGQALIAREMGRTRLIAETGAGQHGVATATAAALLGLPCRVYMGAEDVVRQHHNVVRMELLGAEVVSVDGGSRTLKDATNEAIRDWMGSYRDTHYVIGSVVGPHPYPTIVRTLQRVIGVEARAQILEREGRLPGALVACVGGGSNALGLFHAFIDDDAVAMYGVEAGGVGTATGSHAASISRGAPGVLHGALSYLLQDADGGIAATHSIAAGLDYPGVGPEHALLHDSGRARYVAVSDADALDAYRALSRLEGIIPALESAHAIAYAMRLASDLSPDDVLLVCLSGRGDKDVAREDAKGAAHGATIRAEDATIRAEHEASARELALQPVRASAASVRAASQAAGCDRLAQAFALAAAERRGALIPFLAAGDPSADAFVDLAIAAAEAGADVLEIGLPYADSLADGPTIQSAYARALARGIDIDGVLACAARIAASVATPIVLMTSYNPVRARGVARFVSAAAEAGIAGLLVPDLPHEDAAELGDAAANAGLAVPLLVGPDTSDARAARIARAATGFVYVVRRRGVTGAGGSDDTAQRRIGALRATGSPPIAIGFGIATPEDAARAGAHADGVIVGSALIDIALRARANGPGADRSAVAQAVAAFRTALSMDRRHPEAAGENAR